MLSEALTSTTLKSRFQKLHSQGLHPSLYFNDPGSSWNCSCRQGGLFEFMQLQPFLGDELVGAGDEERNNSGVGKST